MTAQDLEQAYQDAKQRFIYFCQIGDTKQAEQVRAELHLWESEGYTH